MVAAGCSTAVLKVPALLPRQQTEEWKGMMQVWDGLSACQTCRASMIYSLHARTVWEGCECQAPAVLIFTWLVRSMREQCRLQQLMDKFVELVTHPVPNVVYLLDSQTRYIPHVQAANCPGK